MKGVVLAGGTGSRLHPLTMITNKHLLPVGDKPMVQWAIDALRDAGIGDLMLVTGGEHVEGFQRLLGDDIAYGNQERPGGIAEALGLAIDFRQTNSEGELVSWVQECRGRAAGILIAPAAFASTSVALMDALLAAGLPVIEVHLNNNYRREDFRHRSYVARAATGVICGLGARGYSLALTAIAELLEDAA